MIPVSIPEPPPTPERRFTDDSGNIGIIDETRGIVLVHEPLEAKPGCPFWQVTGKFRIAGSTMGEPYEITLGRN